MADDLAPKAYRRARNKRQWVHGRTPIGAGQAHHGVAEGHTPMREMGAQSCAISPIDPLMNHHDPPIPHAEGNGFSEKKTDPIKESIQVPRRIPSFDEILAGYEEFIASNGAGGHDLAQYLAEVHCAIRFKAGDPIHWANKSAREGRFLAKPADLDNAKELLQAHRAGQIDSG